MRQLGVTLSFLHGRRVGVLVVATAILAGGSYWHQVSQEGDRARCQSSYNKAFAVQLTERSRLSSASNSAEHALLAGMGRIFLLPPLKPAPADAKERAKRAEEFYGLFRTYDEVTLKIAADREATPLPPIPNC